MKKTVIPIVLAVIIIGVMYYVMIPPINIKSVDFWWFLVYCLIIVGLAIAIPRGVTISFEFLNDIRDSGIRGLFKRRKERKESGEEKEKKPRSVVFYMLCVIVFLIIGVFVGQIASSPFFNARAYSALLNVENGDFAEEISEISVRNVPVVDRDTAERLGNRTLGEIDDLVSQFAIDQSD